MRIIFCGGGTAGHVTPAIAIAELMKQQGKADEILFIGREGGQENKAIEKCGFNLRTVKIEGFERKISFGAIRKISVAVKALREARKIIEDFSPDIVVGTGGYVSWPVLKSAQKLNIPTAIHESNASPGLVSRILSKKCDVVLLNLQGSEKEFNRTDNIKTVGNPVRRDFFTTSRESARRKLGIGKGEFLLSSFGGSGGSERINDTVAEFMLSYSAKQKNVRHIHSCGKKYYKSLKEKYPALFNQRIGKCTVMPYVEDMPTVLAASDLVISRCGAMTLSEICAVGVAAILIPSPNVTNNHQYKNAKLICESGAAIMLAEAELSADSLAEAVKKIESNAMLRVSMAKRIKSYCVRNSTELIVKEIERICKK